jgi:hypothetical protein
MVATGLQEEVGYASISTPPVPLLQAWQVSYLFYNEVNFKIQTHLKQYH